MISFPPLFSTCFAREKATEGSYIRKERNSYAKTIVLSGLHLSQCLHDRIVDFIEYAPFPRLREYLLFRNEIIDDWSLLCFHPRANLS